MEASGVVLQKLPCFSGGVIDAHSHYYSAFSSKPSLLPGLSFDAGTRFSGELRLLGHRDDSMAYLKSRKFSGVSSSLFCHNGHIEYYSGWESTIMCGGGKKEKDTTEKKMKKRLKLLKGLSRDLSTFSQIGFGLDPDHGLADQVKGKMISEAAELLLGQLERLRLEEKELKIKRKEEKAKLKALRMRNRIECGDSLRSSSESSDSECGEVVKMSCLKSGVLAQPIPNALPEETTLTLSSTLPQERGMLELQSVGQEAMLTLPSTLTLTEGRGLEIQSSQKLEQDCCGGTSTIRSNCLSVGCYDGHSLVTGASVKKIEVCMGGKCKKSGAAAILEEFQRVVGIEGAVAGCKCMGKCKDGPNVRVLNDDGFQADSIRTPASNPLSIDVGMEDVGLIVSNYFGENVKNLGLAVAS